MSDTEPLRINRKYYIETSGQHRIFKNKKYDKYDKLCEEKIDSEGYVRVLIEGIFYRKHQIVASQWFNYKLGHKGRSRNSEVVDHIDRNRLNNNIHNLRIIPQWENHLNDKRREWVDLDETTLKIPFDDDYTYNIYRLDIDNKKLYYTNTKQYSEIKPRSKIYTLYDNWGNAHKLTIEELLKKYEDED